jgi:hypothetical protein
MATEDIEKLVSSAQLEPSTADEDDRVFFTRRFISILDAKPEWWVAERYLEMVRVLGTPDALPVVVRTAVEPVTSGPADARRRAAALTAIAALAGWDPRAGGDGRVLTDEEAAARVAKECSPSASPADAP